MKKALLPVIALLMIASAASAQTVWNRTATWNPTAAVTSQVGQGHGIAVDAAGKIWYQPFYASETIPWAFATPPATTVNTRALYIFNPDGTPASFSPLLYINYAGGVPRDTLGGRTILNATNAKAFDPHTGRGLRADQNGNILVAQFDRLYRLNHTTGAGMNKVIVPGGKSNAAPAVAKDNGLIFVAPVAPGTPMFMYDRDFNPLSNARNKTVGFSRSFEVSKDGNKIYWAGYDKHGVFQYQRADEFSAFDSSGVVIPGMDAESFAWQPGTGWLWVSAGSANDGPNRFPNFTTTWAVDTWYAFNPAEFTVNTVPTAKARLTWVPRPECAALRADPNATTAQMVAQCGRSRGLAFSPDGTKAYVTTFAVNGEPAIQVFSPTATNIETVDSSVPTAFTLEQNYPNPFNPQTNIRFTVNETGMARLTVYDIMGREITRLVDRYMAPGTYEASFDGANLPSGTYIYRLELNGQALTSRMTLLK